MKSKIECRSCQSVNLKPVLSLGDMPLANALLDEKELNNSEEKFPLEILFCTDCSLVQISQIVPPEKLFSNYLYFSSFSDTMLEQVKILVQRIILEKNLGAKSHVVEIASNDGYLLQNYHKAGIPVLGIEPASNIAEVARNKRGINTITKFFNRKLAEDLYAQGKSADVIHAHNVFAHVPNPNDFLEGIKVLLKKKGVAIIESPYVKDMIDKNEFDTIYHEHVSYLSLSSVVSMVYRNGLQVSNIEYLPIHGGSLRYYITHDTVSIQNSVEELLSKEEHVGITNYSYYQSFNSRVAELKKVLKDLLKDLKSADKYIVAYGASAKGSILLNSLNIGNDLISFVVDRNIYKQGKYMPGSHLPIRSPMELLKEIPDYTLLLTWNFEKEILEQQQFYRKNNGRFIIPIPEVRIV